MMSTAVVTQHRGRSVRYEPSTFWLAGVKAMNRIVSISVVVLALLVPLGGCGRNPESTKEERPLAALIGKPCTVQLRRDALGVAAGSPVPPLTNVFNGGEVCVSGLLTHVSSTWIVVKQEPREFHIPISAVLLVQAVNETSEKR
jgi:hypothetical protein